MLDRFSGGQISCIINCMVLTEGTDLPVTDAIINLRPTCNPSLYQQMVGRACRIYPGKDYNLVIDIVPTDTMASLCTAPTLFGIEPRFLDDNQKQEINKDTDLLDLCEDLSDACAEGSKNLTLQIKTVDLFLAENRNLIEKNRDKGILALAKDLKKEEERHRRENKEWDFGSLIVYVQAEAGSRFKIVPSWNEAIYIAEPDILGNTKVRFSLHKDPYKAKGMVPKQYSGTLRMEEAIALAYKFCTTQRGTFAYLWDKDTQEGWASQQATDKQGGKVKKCFKDISHNGIDKLNKLDANRLINLSVEMEEKQEEKDLLTDASMLAAAGDAQKLSKSKIARCKAAKDRVEQRERDGEKEEREAKIRFPAFVENISVAYGRMEEQNKEALARMEEMRDDMGYYLDVAVDIISPKAAPSSQKQDSFVSSLLQSASRRGDTFPGLYPEDLTMRQANGIIQVLLSIEKNARGKARREFFDLGDWLDGFEKGTSSKCRIHYRFGTDTERRKSDG